MSPFLSRILVAEPPQNSLCLLETLQRRFSSH